ncbi:hypothetical protein EV2_032294 [Malus domestica]
MHCKPTTEVTGSEAPNQYPDPEGTQFPTQVAVEHTHLWFLEIYSPPPDPQTARTGRSTRETPALLRAGYPTRRLRHRSGSGAQARYTSFRGTNSICFFLWSSGALL